MKKTHKIFGVGLGIVAVIALAALLLHGHTFALFDPKGIVARKERNLTLITLALSLVVVIPVFAMLIWFPIKYRESNHKNATYRPNWDGSRLAETVWWTVPFGLICVLAVITWNSSHDLDPYRSLASAQKPLTIQVVALQWKWLFIYPEQHIATVNYIQFPAKTPINFKVTADAPMNSLWIPQLGGQIYAMAGMSTQLHLMADAPGSFRGSSANLSGRGFAGMKFIAKASSQAEFTSWVTQVQNSPKNLDSDMYNQLAKPSEHNQVSLLTANENNLYNKVMLKFMVPGHEQLKASDDPNELLSGMHMGMMGMSQ